MANVISYIGLGSNLSNPKQQIATSIESIKKLKNTTLLACSSIYHSKPFGPQNQPDYMNAIIKIKTGFSPLELLEKLHEIEMAQHRVREVFWGPRTIDLDIILYGDLIMTTPTLTIPHLGMRLRPTVLYPLAEISPDLILPDGVAISTLLEQCPPSSIFHIENQEAVA